MDASGLIRHMGRKTFAIEQVLSGLLRSAKRYEAVALALGEIDKPRELAARGAGLVALRHMQDRPVFGAVDPLACEQRRDTGLETRLGRQVQKQTDRPIAKFLA